MAQEIEWLKNLPVELQEKILAFASSDSDKMIMEYKKIKGKHHYIYDHISEFYEEHPNITPIEDWRDGAENDWVWSDDKRIIQLLKVKANISHPNDRKNYSYSKGYCRGKDQRD